MIILRLVSPLLKDIEDSEITALNSPLPRLSFFSVVFIFIVSRFPAATLDRDTPLMKFT